MLAGSIENNKLINSTISGIALGENLKSLSFGTALDGGPYDGSSVITINHSDITRTDGTATTLSPDYNESFTIVSGVTSNDQGHITAITTREVTMPGEQSLPDVYDGLLTLATSGIATGSQTFSANQESDVTFTVDVPGTNLSLGTITSTTVPIESSTGTNISTLPIATDLLAGILSADAQTIGGTKTFADSLIVSGDLTVNGTTTTLNVSEVNIEDNIIKINSNLTAQTSDGSTIGQASSLNTDGGLEVKRYE
jgi:hypothetical protein